jgi:hypothetical protein
MGEPRACTCGALCAGCAAYFHPDAKVIVHENDCPLLPGLRADANGIPCTAGSTGFCDCPRHKQASRG